eukprot:6819106-Alexandrium_andersonii.AAC.1
MQESAHDVLLRHQGRSRDHAASGAFIALSVPSRCCAPSPRPSSTGSSRGAVMCPRWHCLCWL